MVKASPTGPADVDQAGGLSPYGVMGLGGNAREWQESSFDLANSSVSSSRGSRGGSWLFAPGNLSSRNLPNNDPSFEFYLIGFRVAMVQPLPEQSMMVIGMVFGLGGLASKRRLKT